MEPFYCVGASLYGLDRAYCIRNRFLHNFTTTIKCPFYTKGQQIESLRKANPFRHLTSIAFLQQENQRKCADFFNTYRKQVLSPFIVGRVSYTQLKGGYNHEGIYSSTK